MSTRDVNPAAEESLQVYEAAPVARSEHDEDSFTRLIEQQTAKVPSTVFLIAALATMTASLACELAGQRHWSRFLGMWAPTLLIAGVYNKLVKSLGPG